jgi:hypothetical protein
VKAGISVFEKAGMSLPRLKKSFPCAFPDSLLSQATDFLLSQGN